MRSFYLYAERPVHKTIKEIFVGFEIKVISKEDIKKNNFINKNILFILNECLSINLNDSFFLKNNVVIFYLKQKNPNKKKHLGTKIFNGNININKFTDEVITFFVSKSFTCGDIKIWGEKIINLKDKKEFFLTPTEKNILTILFERKKIEKNLLLESALKLRQDTETKTIESHLTRIRKKLQSINSQIEIISKENVIYLVT